MKKKIFSIMLIAFFHTGYTQNYFSEQYPDTINRSRVYGVSGGLAIAYLAQLYHLNFVWYKDSKQVPFTFYDDSETHMQVDKAGHAQGAYLETTIAYYALRWAGLSKKKALIYGGPVGLLFQTPIEVLDGIYEGYGFSHLDMYANTFGSALFVLQEAIWEEQIVLMKFSYSPSKYTQYAPENLGATFGDQIVRDFNAHTYWLSFNLKKITGVQSLPNWFNVAFGYGANGLLGETINPTIRNGILLPKYERHRQYYFSLDVDFSRIKIKSRFLQALFRTLLLKLPFPTVEYNHIEGFVFRPLFF